MKEDIAALAAAFIFTTFNIRWGYNNVCIKDGDQWKAAFKTCFGVYKPMVMYFGLTNSPATFQTMMTFDICWGYNNVCIKDGDQWKAAFKTCFGVYEPMVMYFGLTNSPAMFQTMMSITTSFAPSLIIMLF
jgi:hypothetical protein